MGTRKKETTVAEKEVQKPKGGASRGLTGAITIEKPVFLELGVRLVGDSRLVVHRFSEKAKKDILNRQGQKDRPKVKKARPPRDPEGEYVDSCYRLDGEKIGTGFPALSIKSAMAMCAARFCGIFKTHINGVLHVGCDPDTGLVKVKGSKPVMREDYIRVSGASRGADVRYRGSFELPWSIDLSIVYDEQFIDGETIVRLLDRTGRMVGIGEWRPEKGGDWGRFHVETRK